MPEPGQTKTFLEKGHGGAKNMIRELTSAMAYWRALRFRRHLDWRAQHKFDHALRGDRIIWPSTLYYITARDLRRAIRATNYEQEIWQTGEL